jgi:phosphatidylglycerol:prolipoprotein diacylglycerol transferase
MTSFLLAIPYPVIDPVALELGPLVIRWYSLAYLAGIVVGWRYALYLSSLDDGRPNRRDIDDFMTWLVLGVVVGGRLGYVLFYQPLYFLQNPIEILAVWHGGMAFHGGALGVIVAIVLYCRKRSIDRLAFADIVCCVAPIGLCLGRLANFINGELFGRTTDVWWGMVFPRGGDLPRHPSQLYQAFLEGIVLLLILALLAHQRQIRHRPGYLSGVFLLGYGIARTVGEFFREPDAHLGFIIGPVTMGQLLSVPMVLGGAFLIARARRLPAVTPG